MRLAYELEEITLRAVTRADLQEVARTWNLGRGEVSPEEAAKAIDWMQSNHALNRPQRLVHVCFAVFENGTGRIIGWCGLDGRDGRAVNIFYLIDRDYRRRGHATACAKCLLDYGFGVMGLDRIDGGCAKGNVASQRILERIGMARTADAGDSLHYCLTAAAYRRRSGAGRPQAPGQ